MRTGMRTLQISISAPEPDMNEFCFVAEEIAETFMKAKDAHLLMAQDCFLKIILQHSAI